MSYAYNVKRGARAARARAEQTTLDRQQHGEAYVHMTPLGKWGVRLRNNLAKQGRFGGRQPVDLRYFGTTAPPSWLEA